MSLSYRKRYKQKQTRMHSSRMRSSSRVLGGRSASVHAGIHPPLGLNPPMCEPGDPPPPRCGPGDPPTRPLNPPPGVDLETPSARPLNLPPWVWAWRSPQNSWHTLLKILPCPNFVAGGKKSSNKPKQNSLYIKHTGVTVTRWSKPKLWRKGSNLSPEKRFFTYLYLGNDSKPFMP